VKLKWSALDLIWDERESILQKGHGEQWISTDFRRKGKEKMKTKGMRVVEVLDLEVLQSLGLGSKSDADFWCVCVVEVLDLEVLQRFLPF